MKIRASKPKEPPPGVQVRICGSFTASFGHTITVTETEAKELLADWNLAAAVANEFPPGELLDNVTEDDIDITDVEIVKPKVTP